MCLLSRECVFCLCHFFFSVLSVVCVGALFTFVAVVSYCMYRTKTLHFFFTNMSFFHLFVRNETPHK